MNVRRGGLGRGLGALIPTAPSDPAPAVGEPAVLEPADSLTPAPAAQSPATQAPVDETSPGETAAPGPAAPFGARFAELPIASIEPNPRQPREVFDDEALAELVTSVREVGVLQPVVVREIGAGRYQLVMGERRWRACTEAGMEVIPAIIRDTPDDALLRDALLENLHRQQLNPLEEAAAYQQLLEEFGATHDELATRIGRSRSQVSNTIRLLGLPPSVQRRVGAGVLSAGHARALLSLGDPETQEKYAARVVAEGLSVRAVEELVATSSEPAVERARAQKGPKAPGLSRLEAELSELLETKVSIELGRRRGKLTVAFASYDDLQRVLGVLAPQVLSERSLDGSRDGPPSSGEVPRLAPPGQRDESEGHRAEDQWNAWADRR
jgi:ParB family transcriptional regulator, chromosome partitioning protein